MNLGRVSSQVHVNMKHDLFVHDDVPDFMMVMASYYAVKSMLHRGADKSLAV
jgi:hypothetical protein